MKWINVEDKLPELGENAWRHEKPVIALAKDGCVYTAFFCKRDDRNFINNSYPPKWFVSQQYDAINGEQIEVTHWMPLPEPPENK